MKLLIITQSVDKNSPVLGFFHRWVEEFAKHAESLVVICLSVGEFDLPKNVRVMSLGKEEGLSRLEYVKRFYKYIWRERRNYDSVFVHMNQEYVLLAGVFWKLMSKKVSLWRNHLKGSWLTNVAVILSDKVFFTSPSSYTARFKKAQKMPVGIDTNFFKPDPNVHREPKSILFLGRIAPVKRVLEFVNWFDTLDDEFTATVAGDPLPKDVDYLNLVKSQASKRIKFIGAVTQTEALKLYQSHEIYVNKTPAGSFDKTIFEAASCGMKVLVDNEDLKFLEGKAGGELRGYVEDSHSLELLVKKVTKAIQ